MRSHRLLLWRTVMLLVSGQRAKIFMICKRFDNSGAALTAAAWQYIGSQGVIQGTYEIFAAIVGQSTSIIV